MRHSLHNAYKGLAENLVPLRTAPGGFRTEGVLTPDEFVSAGDFLVATVPTWAWEGGERSRLKSFLPPNKQYLVTRNVPCFRRAAAAEGESEAPESLVEEGGIGSTPDDSGWLAPGLPGGGVEVVDEAESVSAPSDAGSTQSSLSTFARRAAELATEPAEAVVENPAGEEEAVLEDAATDDRPVPDISDWAQQDALATQLGASKLETGSGGGGGGGGGEGEDAASLPYMTAREPEDPILRTRTYDVSITYDRYYQTPRIWLAGFDERRAPLPPAAALADVSSEHARKTVTIDGHPHTGAAAVSIHPCKHGAVMKRLADTMAEGGVAPRDEHYLLLFLRLVQTAIPTVEYDFSVQM